VGDDVRERGLAEARGPAEQYVIERFAPALRRIDEHAQILLDPVLSDKILKTDRPQTAVKLKVLIMLFGFYDSFFHDPL
jgi:hypothetical protein